MRQALIPVKLCIAGDMLTFEFDGEAVYQDGQLVETFDAPCGAVLPQEILVQICRDKIEKN